MRSLDVTLGTAAVVLIDETKRASAVLITAGRENVGLIWYGDAALQNQYLAPGEGPITLHPYLLNDIHARAETEGDIVTLLIED